ncbi:MAG: rRNA maturation RNase YbeY [Elusimicrobia bacterium]|nr:rRNA maturation RNase YbeY [Elusimicrobiota bacterium]
MKKEKVPQRLARKIAAYIISHYLPQDKDYELGLFFVNQAEMIRLNKIFFNRNYATDVIAAPIETASSLPVVMLGEVFVCLDAARRQAREYQHAYEAEIALLVTHGILHLLGYDDLTLKKRKIMHREEQKILKELNSK